MRDALYTLEQVQQIYRGRCVLDIDEMHIQQGEILAIVGPSGAGKSTLLRLLNFLEPPSAGRITFERQPINENVPLATRRRVTTVFQQPALLNRSVAANLRFGLSLRGQKLRAELQQRWLEKLGLTKLVGQAVRKLSAGEAQRVALARALLVQPDVLLLDEPTANLDPYNVRLIESIVEEENGRAGTTIVLVTHNIFQARRLAHRTALLLNGKLIELAETGAFFDRPQHPKTAAFVRGDLIY